MPLWDSQLSLQGMVEQVGLQRATDQHLGLLAAGRWFTFTQMALSHWYLQNPRQISPEIKRCISLDRHFCSCCCLFNASVRITPINKCLFSQLQDLRSSCLWAHWPQHSFVQVSAGCGCISSPMPRVIPCHLGATLAAPVALEGALGQKREGRGKKGGTNPPP